MFTTGNGLAVPASSASPSSANSASITSVRTSRSSPYSHGYGSYGSSNNMHHQNTASYPEYSSMYQAMDPTMAWHAAYQANLYRSYADPHAAEASMWSHQPHHHSMNTFMPSNELEPGSGLTSAAIDGSFASAAAPNVTSTASSAAASLRPNSPSEYKVFNESRAAASEAVDIKAIVRPSPDSGVAEAMSNSGSPNQGQQGLLAQQSQGSPGGLILRPQPARSPYEWMKRPSNGIQSRPKEGKLFFYNV